MELIRVIQKIYEKTTKVRREAIKRDEEEPTLIYIYIYIEKKKERKKERERENVIDLGCTCVTTISGSDSALTESMG